MFNINGDVTGQYIDFVTGAMTAFLPLMGVVIGTFLAFAIANMLRHMILKMK